MEKTLQYGDVTLHYKVSGQGKPLILMHGWGCDSSTVASIEKVAAETHTVYNVDFPGFGASNEPSEIWGVEQYTRIIEQLARSEEMQSPALIGHSFGGRVGLLFSSRNPVSKLILVDAAGVKPRHGLKWHCKVYSFKLGKWWTRLTHSKQRAEEIIERQRAARGSSDYRNASPRMRAIMTKVVNEDLKHVMPLIKAPTLLIWGENDTATPLSDAKIMNKLIPDTGLVSFPRCGHYSFLDNPLQFAAVLRSFLNS